MRHVLLFASISHASGGSVPSEALTYTTVATKKIMAVKVFLIMLMSQKCGLSKKVPSKIESGKKRGT